MDNNNPVILIKGYKGSIVEHSNTHVLHVIVNLSIDRLEMNNIPIAMDNCLSDLYRLDAALKYHTINVSISTDSIV